MNRTRLHHHRVLSDPPQAGSTHEATSDAVVRELADHVYALVSDGHGLEPVVASLLGRRASGASLSAVARLARTEALSSGPEDHWAGVARKMDLVQNFCPHLFRRAVVGVA